VTDKMAKTIPDKDVPTQMMTVNNIPASQGFVGVVIDKSVEGRAPDAKSIGTYKTKKGA
jgi:hypothetical protein